MAYMWTKMFFTQLAGLEQSNKPQQLMDTLDFWVCKYSAEKCGLCVFIYFWVFWRFFCVVDFVVVCLYVQLVGAKDCNPGPHSVHKLYHWPTPFYPVTEVQIEWHTSLISGNIYDSNSWVGILEMEDTITEQPTWLLVKPFKENLYFIATQMGECKWAWDTARWRSSKSDS